MIQKTYFKTKTYCKVKFSVDAATAETVAVLGLNNDWENAISLKKKKDGAFSGEVNLNKDSRHEFKYLVDSEQWLNETEADDETANIYGGTNSVLVI